MNCSKYGYNMGPLDRVCARCNGNGLASQPTAPTAAPVPSPTSQQDMFGAVLCVVMVMIGAGLIYYLIYGVSTHEQFISAGRFGRNPIPYAPFSLT